MHTKIRILTGIFFLATVLLISGFTPNAYSAIQEKIELSPGQSDSWPLKLDELQRIHGGITIEGIGGINIESLVDDKVKFWITYPDGTHLQNFGLVDTSASFDFTTTKKGTYTFFFENSDALIGFKTITLTYNQEDKRPPPDIEEIVDDVSGGGCLIATATYGSELSPQVQFLREFRDNTVLSTEIGTTFMTYFNQVYYSFSPTIADLERESSAFKELVKVTITPMLSTLSILNYVNIDSEAEMLSYGIGIIMLNVGMYFGLPVFAIMKLRKVI